MVEQHVDQAGRDIAGQKPERVEPEFGAAPPRRALAKLMHRRRQDRGCRPVHDRRPEPAHHPHRRGQFGIAPQVEDILDDRETGADGEARNDRIQLEADAVAGEQQHHRQPFQRLLDPRCDDAAVEGKAHRQRVQHLAADRPGGQRGDSAEDQQAEHLPDAHQLEDVEPGEQRRHQQDRHQRQRPVDHFRDVHGLRLT